MDPKKIKKTLKKRATDIIDSAPIEEKEVQETNSQDSNLVRYLLIFSFGGFCGILLAFVWLSFNGTIPSLLETIISAIIGGIINLIFNNAIKQ